METAMCKFIILSLFILYPMLGNANNVIDNEKLRVEYIEKGAYFSSIKQYNNAIEYFDKAIKLNSKKSTPYFKKACALFHLKRYEEAINEYDKAFDVNKDSKDLKEKREKQNIFILTNKSSTLLKLQKYEKVIECCNLGLKLTQKEPLLYNNKGDALYYLKKYKEAINEYNKALEVLNNSPDKETGIKHLFGLYNNKGASLLALGRYEEAIDNYNKAIEFKPDHIEANANKLCPLYRLGRYQEAVETADKILGLDPKNQKAMYFKKQALIQLKQS